MRLTLFAFGLFLCGLVQATEIDAVKYTMEDPPATKSSRNDLQRIVARAWREGKLKPAERSTHFESLVKDETLLITSWKGQIKKMTPTPNGWQVEIRVSPEFQKNPGKGDVFFNCEYYETYEATGKSLKFLKSEHTEGSHHFLLKGFFTS